MRFATKEAAEKAVREKSGFVVNIASSAPYFVTNWIEN